MKIKFIMYSWGSKAERREETLQLSWTAALQGRVFVWEALEQRRRTHFTESLCGGGQVTSAPWDLSFSSAKWEDCATSAVPKPSWEGGACVHTLIHSHTLPQPIGPDTRREKEESCIFNQLWKGHWSTVRAPCFLRFYPNPSCHGPSPSAQLPRIRVLSADSGLQPLRHPLPPLQRQGSSPPTLVYLCFIVVSPFHNCSIIISLPLILGTLPCPSGKNFLAVINKVFDSTSTIFKSQVLE